MSSDSLYSEALDDENPFREPEATRVRGVLHPVAGVVWAAFWGTVLAAGLVMALNYLRMKKPVAALLTVLIAVAATTVLFALIIAIPDDRGIPNVVFVAPQLIAVFAVANALQGKSVARHQRQGGTVASVWPGIGIGILCLPVVFGILFGVVYFTVPDELHIDIGNQFEFGNDEIYCSGEATEEDARELADLLLEFGFFGTEGGTSVGFRKLSGQDVQYALSFVVIDGGWNDPDIVDALTGLGELLIESGYAAPLMIHLCDDAFTTRKTIRVE